MRILLIGREGQLGWELRRTLACLGEVIAIDRTSRPWFIDLSDPDSIRTAVRGLRPQLIVNAAAYTGVDVAEKEEELATMINGVAPGILAETAAELGAGLIHYSTDYVFSGEASSPYDEAHETAPLGVYGKTKRQGEVAIEQVGIPHLILRTAWVYGTRGHNFLLTMLRLMGERESLSIVSDQHGAPSWSREIAECTAFMIAQCQNREADTFDVGDRSGIYHLTNNGQTNWYEFANAIRKQAVTQGLLEGRVAELEPILGREYPTPAKRPSWSVLSNQKLKAEFGLQMPAWQQSLQLCMDELGSAKIPR